MAHFITDSEALSLIKIANLFVGPAVDRGLIRQCDREDAVQDMLLHVVRTGEEFCDGGSAKFITFAYCVMQNEIRRVVRRHNLLNVRVITDALPLDALFRAADADEQTAWGAEDARPPLFGIAAESGGKQNGIAARVRRELAKMPRGLQDVCRLLMRGCSIGAVCSILGLSRKAVRWRLKKIRKTLAEAFPEKFLKNFSENRGQF